MSDLTVVVPSRGRPEAIAELREAFVQTGATAELLVVLDEDDPRLSEYSREDLSLVVESSGMVNALNAGAKLAARLSIFVGFLGDDHRPRTPGWDRRLRETLERIGTGFVYGNDLLQGEAMPTAVAMTSDVVFALGYMAPPALTHLNVDIAWLEWGRALDRIVYLEDVVIEHLHPANGKAELDEGYLRVNSQEMVARDGEAWAAYVAGGLEGDLDKLRRLLR